MNNPKRIFLVTAAFVLTAFVVSGCFTAAVIASIKVSRASMGYCIWHRPIVEPPQCEAVDLGLGVKWSNWNQGAVRPRDYGFYYQWHDIRMWNNGGSGDIANVLLGDKWKVPDDDDWKELRTRCEWEWISCKDSVGYVVRSMVPGYEGKSIFLPAAGRVNFLSDRMVMDIGDGFYMTSSKTEMYFFSERGFWPYHCYEWYEVHSYAISVRPVYDEDYQPVEGGTTVGRCPKPNYEAMYGSY